MRDGSLFVEKELPGSIVISTKKEVRNVVVGIHYQDTGEYRWIIVNAVPQFTTDNNEVSAVYITIDDITERKRAEQALLESEQRLDSILSSLEDIVYSVTADTVERVYLNPAAEEIYGRPVTFFYNDPNNWKNVIHPDDLNIVEDLVREINVKGSAEAEYRIMRPDGSLRWLHDRGWLYTDESGKPLRIDGIETDITERKLAEEALRESEERFRSIYEHSPVGIQLYDQNGLFVQTNEASLKMFDVVDEQDLQVLNLFNAPNLNEEMKQKLRNGESVAFENMFDFDLIKRHNVYRTSKSGSIHVNTLITPLTSGANQAISGYLVQILDITERKLAEVAAKESEEFNRDLIALAPDGIAYLNSQAEVVFANPAMLDLIGVFFEGTSDPKDLLQHLTDAIRSEFSGDIEKTPARRTYQARRDTVYEHDGSETAN